MAQVYKLRLPDGRMVRPTEWSSTPLYSVVEVAAGAITDLQAFSYSVGGSIPGSPGPRVAQEMDTNMRGPGSILPENEELLLYSIMVELFTIGAESDNGAGYFLPGNDVTTPNIPEVSALNVARFQRDTLLELKIADTKNYLRHPVAFFPAGMGIYTLTGDARNDVGGFILGGGNGSTNTYDRRELATPHQVKGGEAFAITFVFPSGSVSGLNFGADTNGRLVVRTYADGYRKRPVA